MLRAIGVVVAVPEGLEADDVLASAAAYAPTVGARTVVATSDRDSFALIDEHTKMLRILNGGVDASPLLDPQRLVMVTGVRPDQYLDYAALRGDASDNLPGVAGIGPKTAARLLAEFGSAGAAFDDACGDGDAVHAGAGPLDGPQARGPRGPRALAAELPGDDDAPDRRRSASTSTPGSAACRSTRPRSGRRSRASSCTCRRPCARSPARRPRRRSRPTSTPAGSRNRDVTRMRHPPLRRPVEPEPASVQETLF